MMELTGLPYSLGDSIRLVSRIAGFETLVRLSHAAVSATVDHPAGAVTTPMPQHPPMPNVRPVPGHYMPSPRMLYTTPPPAPGLTGPYQMPPSYASAPAQLASSAFGQAVIPPTQVCFGC